MGYASYKTIRQMFKANQKSKRPLESASTLDLDYACGMGLQLEEFCETPGESDKLRKFLDVITLERSTRPD